MQGKLISFNHENNQGLIIADDGIQYTFHGHCWTEQSPPKAGDNVTFIFDTTNGINKVSYAAANSHNSIPLETRVSLIKSSLTSINTPPVLPVMTPHTFGNPSNQQIPYQSQTESQRFSYQENNQIPNDGQSQLLAELYEKERSYSLIDWTRKVVFDNYANFQGRARRQEYWLFCVGYMILSIIALIVDVIIGTDELGLVQSLLGRVLSVIFHLS